MSEFLLGLAALPTIAGLAFLTIRMLARTNRTGLSCGCGKDWGNPRERGWRVWWEPIVLTTHDRGRKHREWRKGGAA